MNELAIQYLRDALNEARALQLDLLGLNQKTFERSRQLQRVTERSLEIIGEAIRRTLHEFPSPESDYPKITDWIWLRNVISHQYDNIVLDVIWEAATNELDELVLTLESVLG